jgi:hypothetical protein
MNPVIYARFTPNGSIDYPVTAQQITNRGHSFDEYQMVEFDVAPAVPEFCVLMQRVYSLSGLIRVAFDVSALPLEALLKKLPNANRPPFEEVPAEEPSEALIARIIKLVEERALGRIARFARTRDYGTDQNTVPYVDPILAVTSYANSTTPRFKSDAEYCVAKRDETWGILINLATEVKAGTKPMPVTTEEILGLLPVLEWPADPVSDVPPVATPPA